MRLSNQQLGKLGEDFAAKWFIDKGFRLLDRNWRHGRVELDLVVGKDDLVIFVEVKTRTNSDFGGAVAAITKQKVNNLTRAALYWLGKNRYAADGIRIDLLALQYDGKDFRVTHIPGISSWV